MLGKNRWIVILSIICGFWIYGGCSQKAEKITIAFSNDTMGQIRSCGCVEKDVGGLGRRATFVKIARDTSENLVLLDGGDFFGTKINYGKEKAEITLKAMAVMGYDGVVIGEKDLGLGVNYLIGLVEKIGLPVLLANVYYSDSDSLLFPPRTRFSLASGRNVTLIGVISNKIPLPPQVRIGELTVRSPETAVRANLSKTDPKDLVIILAHMDKGEAIRLAEQIDGIDLIVCGHEGRAVRKVRKFNGAYILQIPKEGRFMGVAGGTLDKSGCIQELKVKTEGLTKAYPDHEAIAKLFKAYDMDISIKEQSKTPKGLYNSIERGENFSGTESCGKCHAKIYESWQKTAHAHAFATLEAQSRQYDRDCTPCHTTGFYSEGGFVNVEATPELINVQCEACHGKGAKHSKSPEKAIEHGSRHSCMQCHVPRHSPGFFFEEYWKRIEH